MFDIGFAELLLLATVGLLVLGPERLPEAARTMGVMFGRLRRSFNSLRAEVQRELHAEELRARLEEERKNSGLEELRDSIEATVREAQEPFRALPESRPESTPESRPETRPQIEKSE